MAFDLPALCPVLFDLTHFPRRLAILEGITMLSSETDEK